MSEGEITQLKKSKSLDIDESTYFKIIKEKTASLFSSVVKWVLYHQKHQKKHHINGGIWIIGWASISN